MNEVQRNALTIMRDAIREKLDAIKAKLVSLPPDLHTRQYRHWVEVETCIDQLLASARAELKERQNQERENPK